MKTVETAVCIAYFACHFPDAPYGYLDKQVTNRVTSQCRKSPFPVFTFSNLRFSQPVSQNKNIIQRFYASTAIQAFLILRDTICINGELNKLSTAYVLKIDLNIDQWNSPQYVSKNETSTSPVNRGDQGRDTAPTF